MSQLLFTDFETTGLNPKKHEIIDIGAVLADAETLEVIDEFESKVRPIHIETAEPAALAVNGYNEVEWEGAPLLVDALGDFERFGNGSVFTAQNVCFDHGFYLEALDKCRFLKSRLNYHRLDVGSMAYPLVQPYQLSLEKICLVLGIQPEPAPHRGLAGARREYQVVRKLRLMAQQGRTIINPDCLLQILEEAA